MIVKRGDKYAVTTADGSRVLGKHSTQEEAEAQLRAIEASKARLKGALSKQRERSQRGY